MANDRFSNIRQRNRNERIGLEILALGISTMTNELLQIQEQRLKSMRESEGLLASKKPVRAGCDMAWDDEKAVREPL
jgi:hypothetical protein